MGYARQLGRAILLADGRGREPHGDVCGLERLVGHADQVPPERVEVDGVPQLGGERGHHGLTGTTAAVASASAVGPPVPGWWVTWSSTTLAAPNPSMITPSVTASVGAARPDHTGTVFTRPTLGTERSGNVTANRL